MKKLISLTLALLLVFSLATVASAEAEPAVVDRSDPTDAGTPTTFNFYKEYVDQNGNVLPNDVIPTEDITFSIEADTENPANVIPTIGNSGVVTVSTNPAVIAINIPAYEEPGVYKYRVSETKTADATDSLQGVTYSNNTFDVTVWVYYDEVTGGDTTTRVLKKVVTFTEAVTGEDGSTYKDDTITNTYSIANFNITKNVSGQYGCQDNDNPFLMKVTLSSAKKVGTVITFDDEGTNGTLDDGVTNLGADGMITPSEWSTEKNEQGNYTVSFYIWLVHGETITLNNLPDGVVVNVEEDRRHTVDPNDTNADVDLNDKDSGYVVSYEGNDTAVDSAAEVTQVITVNNVKNGEIATGITLDSIPFILILAVCAGAVVLFVVKRRRSVDF